METKQLLNNVSGTGNSPSFLIDRQSVEDTEVQVFMTFTGGTVTLEASANNVNFAPFKDSQFSASEVVPVDLAEGSYLRISYAGVTGLTAFVKPKADSNE